ncbi:MAG: hypothetical protein ACI9I4_000888 [Neolewinella sp.]|jgi:hypothetical protein
MNSLNKALLLFVVVFMFVPTAYSQNNADPGIGILMIPASLESESDGILRATVGNYGNLTIVADSLRVTISVGANAEIVGIAAGSDARWSQSTLTTGPANTIRLTNTGGAFSPFDVDDILLEVKGKVTSGPVGILANIVYITAGNPSLCAGCVPPPLNASQGNARNLVDPNTGNALESNDNSSTSLTVTAALGVPDLTPIITILPSIMVGPTDFEIFVQVVELLDADTSGTITVRIPKDPRWLHIWDSTATSLPVSGNPLNNSIWTFSEDANALIFTASATILGTTQSNLGFPATWSPGQTTGSFTASVVIVSGSGAEIRTDNNTDAEQADYSFE